MDKTQKSPEPAVKVIGADFLERFWEESWTYIKTVVDVVREPVLILDKDFRVMAANDPFYTLFQVKPKETEKKVVYTLGNGQWNIPALRKLLEDILPKHTFFKGFEVAHEFPFIGHKVIILNARQIQYRKKDATPSKLFPEIILLAMEDVTEMMAIADSFASRAKELEEKLAVERTDKMGVHISALEKEVENLKKRINESGGL